MEQGSRDILKDDGLLVAPAFTHANNGGKEKVIARLMELCGFKAYHKWTDVRCCVLIQNSGFCIETKAVLHSGFPLTYVEATKLRAANIHKAAELKA